MRTGMINEHINILGYNRNKIFFQDLSRGEEVIARNLQISKDLQRFFRHNFKLYFIA